MPPTNEVSQKYKVFVIFFNYLHLIWLFSKATPTLQHTFFNNLDLDVASFQPRWWPLKALHALDVFHWQDHSCTYSNETVRAYFLLILYHSLFVMYVNQRDITLTQFLHTVCATNRANKISLLCCPSLSFCLMVFIFCCLPMRCSNWCKLHHTSMLQITHKFCVDLEILREQFLWRKLHCLGGGGRIPSRFLHSSLLYCCKCYIFLPGVALLFYLSVSTENSEVFLWACALCMDCLWYFGAQPSAVVHAKHDVSSRVHPLSLEEMTTSYMKRFFPLFFSVPYDPTLRMTWMTHTQ